MNLEDSLVRDIKLRKPHLQERLIKWGLANYRKYPWRENRTPYSVLVSEILLKRTTASATERVFEDFMSSYPDLETLSKADRTELKRLLKKIGYHKQRTAILVELAEYILDKFNGQIPNTKEDLLDIPNVGQYTAGAILSLGYSIPSAMVDSNVERIIRRLFLKHLSKKKSFRIVLHIAEVLAPSQRNQDYNFALLDFGALICTYGLPRCGICPIIKWCDYSLAGNPYRTVVQDVVKQ